MTTPSVGAVLEQVRAEFGPRLVASRVEAEDDARRILDERAGRMSRADFVDLALALNRHEVSGTVKQDRFAPAFTKISVLQATGPVDELNEAMRVLWGTSEDDALDLVDQILRTPSRLPGAGSSLPTTIMYLREPEKYGVLINATTNGLKVATRSDTPYKARGRDDYSRFCRDLSEWREQWQVSAQEHDAILIACYKASKKALQKRAVEVAGGVEAPSTQARTEAEEMYSTSADVARLCHLPVETVDGWVAALTEGRLRQAFFHGPPVTGKTWVARHLADHLATSPEHVRLVQFHPAFSYEDFVEGLRPEVEASSGSLTYAVRPGLFKSLCAEAAAAPEQRFVLVVDEMNRADLAAVFGELLLLLEYRGQSARLPYSHESFTVPENLVLLGTMNTADRSLALVDFALRRRFHALALRPDREVLRRWLVARDVPSDLPLRVFELIADRVGDDPAAPGHSYWMDSDDGATLERTWTFQVHPYLAELWFDRPERLRELDREVRLLLGEGS